ncbi:MAG: hypothetical protein PHY44_06470, partial [Lachnospiraceae bacterium]|nr:hypothetical protein [Lachnospiraceae bacterium]
MKKKIALLLSALMVVGMIPATAFAVTTNTVSHVVTGSEDALTYTVAGASATELEASKAPIFKIAEKNLTDYYLGNAGVQEHALDGQYGVLVGTTTVTFIATLTNAEFKYVGNVGGAANTAIGTGSTGYIQNGT